MGRVSHNSQPRGSDTTPGNSWILGTKPKTERFIDRLGAAVLPALLPRRNPDPGWCGGRDEAELESRDLYLSRGTEHKS